MIYRNVIRNVIVDRHPRYLTLARPPRRCGTDEPEEGCQWVSASHRLAFALWNRIRRGQRRGLADRSCAERQRRRRDKEVVTLPRRRTIGICGGVARHATARKGVNVWVGADAGVSWVEAVRERLHESHDQIFLVIRQAEHSNRHVDVVRDLGHRPAIYFL